MLSAGQNYDVIRRFSQEQHNTLSMEVIFLFMMNKAQKENWRKSEFDHCFSFIFDGYWVICYYQSS